MESLAKYRGISRNRVEVEGLLFLFSKDIKPVIIN